MSDRRNRPANRCGCKPTGDVCVQHDEALECRHGCTQAEPHGCGAKQIGPPTLAALYTAVRAEADRLLPGLRVRRVRGGVAVHGAWTLHVCAPGHAASFDAPTVGGRMREWPDWRVGLRDLALDTARAEAGRRRSEWNAAADAFDAAVARLAALDGQ